MLYWRFEGEFNFHFVEHKHKHTPKLRDVVMETQISDLLQWEVVRYLFECDSSTEYYTFVVKGLEMREEEGS